MNEYDALREQIAKALGVEAGTYHDDSGWSSSNQKKKALASADEVIAVLPRDLPTTPTTTEWGVRYRIEGTDDESEVFEESEAVARHEIRLGINGELVKRTVTGWEGTE